MNNKQRVLPKNTFADLKNLALQDNQEIRSEWEWVNKVTKSNISFLPNKKTETEKHKLGVDAEIILNHQLEELQLAFLDLENNLISQKGCFMDKYSFESNQINWLVSLIDQNSIKENKADKIDMTKTTRIIVNKLDI
ncbi:hypothetical protein [Mycoplasma hafezii]|uniref:hypothetical protein n=1 Tax=Mycoplasma hafezii TaxID=525886 RepID=UPI003CEA460E